MGSAIANAPCVSAPKLGCFASPRIPSGNCEGTKVGAVASFLLAGKVFLPMNRLAYAILFRLVMFASISRFWFDVAREGSTIHERTTISTAFGIFCFMA